MTKVKMFASNDGVRLEQAVNDFIKDKLVIDIKYQSFVVGTAYNGVGAPIRQVVLDRALVIYEDFGIENKDGDICVCPD